MYSVSHRPTFGLSEAADIFVDTFDLKPSHIETLAGERDQNFLVTTDDGRRFVLKISHPDEPTEFTLAQEAALARVNHLAFVPRLLSTKQDSLLGEITRSDRSHSIRAVSYFPGTPLAEVRRPSRYLLADLGAKLAELDLALHGFDHPTLHRDFDWNLLHGTRVLRDNLEDIPDDVTQQIVSRLSDRIARSIDRYGAELRQAAVHNDANDYNVIVSRDRDAHGERLVTGIIDFGDMAWTYLIAELAVAIAYIVCRRKDPLDAACEVIEAYHQIHPLHEVEIACLFDLILLRLCVSVRMSVKQQRDRPDDGYLSISQQPIRGVLPLLEEYEPRFVEAKFRAACGMGPSPKAVRISAWIHRERQTFHPVMGMRLDAANCDLMDLSVANAPIPLGQGRIGTARDGHESVQQASLETMRFAIGRYDEPRLIYSNPLFSASPADREIDERRTIHLGIDIGAPAGHEILAPIDGHVVVSEFRESEQDYGGLIILRHNTEAGESFYTLYGHLSRHSVEGVKVGDEVLAGAALGELGGPDENGGWSPHLHLQLITDLLGLDGDFPGVAFARERGMWTAISPNPSDLAGIADALQPDCTAPRNKDALQVRRQALGPSLSLAYRRPLQLVRGSMQYVFDVEGRRYLDAYNNVPHVGHCHPRVVAAATRQMATLNVNTRYLHDALNEYAMRISATLPDPLEVCYFLNSASEANELALRLARQATGRRAVVVQEAAYHGHTTTLIDISPYKHDGPGGRGTPSWVHKVPLPDRYRGRFRGDDCGKAYAEVAARIIHEAGADQFPPAAFLAETFPSVGGQIVPPRDYLMPVYDAIRSIGGLAIADEVQTGFGRIGSHFWAFERYGATPDIVVMGKPMGNGHPIAAVVTTRSIAAAFDNGMEFFSTFGGNTVSCAIGLAVLDVLAEEELQRRALETGHVLEAGFRELAEVFPILGDVRGSGLFWGLELVRDRDTLEPADAEATLISNRLRAAGILIGTDGPRHNVLKIRPPMPFNAANAETLLAVLREVLHDEFAG